VRLGLQHSQPQEHALAHGSGVQSRGRHVFEIHTGTFCVVGVLQQVAPEPQSLRPRWHMRIVTHMPKPRVASRSLSHIVGDEHWPPACVQYLPIPFSFPGLDGFPHWVFAVAPPASPVPPSRPPSLTGGVDVVLPQATIISIAENAAHLKLIMLAIPFIRASIGIQPRRCQRGGHRLR